MLLDCSQADAQIAAMFLTGEPLRPTAWSRLVARSAPRGVPPPREWRDSFWRRPRVGGIHVSEFCRGDGVSGVEPMKAVTTFVMGAIGLAGVAVGLPLGL